MEQNGAMHISRKFGPMVNSAMKVNVVSKKEGKNARLVLKTAEDSVQALKELWK